MTTMPPVPGDQPAFALTPGVDLARVLDRELSRTPDLAGRIQLLSSAAAGRVAFSTSLGIEDQAILHAIGTSGAAIDVFTLDTGRLFAETIGTIAASEALYGPGIRVLAPDAEGVEALVSRDGVQGFRNSIAARKACCQVRKVLPLKRGLAGASGWITGLRREQSAGRASVPFAAWDAEFSLIKFNPIADWPLQQLEAYIAEHNIPINPLHANGFPSIGCEPCTRAIAPGEDIRAGRWWWESEDSKECGLHSAAREEKAA
ncbi:MAG: phosphoadenylyl-sulfate reductase [Rhodomicrobium sp.]